MLLLIDNYDSFVHNLARYFRRLGQETLVVRNDAIDAAGALKLGPEAIVISPGPCSPNEAGCSLEIVRELTGEVPILGVCLGHQAIAAALGGKVIRAREPMHGRTSEVLHYGQGLFEELPSPLVACRYHSLVVEEATLPECLEASAHTKDGVVMALAHREHPVFGVQFHPEAILTQGGFQMLANFLRLAGLVVPAGVPPFEQELVPATEVATLLPTAPVTF
jgi:anthranilate synthase/aminodeoxychorismate synthase-like glutamine amidotransferase